MEESYNYTRKDLISFGKYLLSEERIDLIRQSTPEGIDVDNRLKDVYHSDVENWKTKRRAVKKN